MILGIGCDCIEIERVRKACEKEAFLTRIYTVREIEAYRNSPRRLSGNFAVKEAVSKVLGTGFRGFTPRDIEVTRNELGAPEVTLYNGAREKAETMGIRRIHVTITNTEREAFAVTIGEGE